MTGMILLHAPHPVVREEAWELSEKLSVGGKDVDHKAFEILQQVPLLVTNFSYVVWCHLTPRVVTGVGDAYTVESQEAKDIHGKLVEVLGVPVECDDEPGYDLGCLVGIVRICPSYTPITGKIVTT